MFNSPLFGKVLFNEPLHRHMNMKVGGPARVWIEPRNKKELCAIAELTKNIGATIFVIGKGCNIIVGEKGVTGICVRLNAPAFNLIEFNTTLVRAGAGVLLSELLDKSSKRSLGGCEFLAGIPGTIGGAISSNAGARNKAVSSLLKEIEIIDEDGNLRNLRKADIKFGYRKSNLSNKIIISALFEFKRKNMNATKNLLRENLTRKIEHQDYTAPSAGCIFKNPSDSAFSAAKLIESCFLKGKARGGAQISDRHANFILNKNNATSRDILSLIKLAKDKVRASYGIELEEEVKIIR